MTNKVEEEDNGKGYYDDQGDYVPTAEELREKYPDIPKERNLDSDKYRKQIWARPTTRNLVPFKDKADADAKRLNGQEARRMKKLKSDEAKEQRSFLLGLIREELEDSASDISPSAVMQMLLKQALADGDVERAEEIATKLLEFEKPKLARIDQRNEEVTTVNTKEDLEAFLRGDIDSEELERRKKGV